MTARGTGVQVEVPLRWGDQDALGHANNTVFFRFCEEGRVAYFRRLGTRALEPRLGAGVVLVAANLHFRRELRHPASVRVVTRVSALSRRSFTFSHRIQDLRGRLLAEGEAVCAWVDFRAGRAVPVPGPVVAALVRREGRGLLAARPRAGAARVREG